MFNITDSLSVDTVLCKFHSFEEKPFLALTRIDALRQQEMLQTLLIHPALAISWKRTNIPKVLLPPWRLMPEAHQNIHIQKRYKHLYYRGNAFH